MSDDPESTMVQRLRAIAGAPDGADTFELAMDGVRIVVRYVSGSGSFVALRASYPFPGAAPATAGEGGYREAGHHLAAIRPLAIELRRENAADVQAKTAGINREFQTGDASFDAKVYVDTPTDARVLAALFRPPEVRGAVVAMLELGVSSVRIGEERDEVTTTVHSFPKPAEHPDAADRLVRAFATLVRALPAVGVLQGARAPDAWRKPIRWLAALGAVLFFALAPIYFSLVLPARCVVPGDEGISVASTLPCLGPGIAGLVCGLVLGIACGRAARVAATPALGGRSDSAGRLTGVFGVVCLCVFDVASLVITALLYRVT